MNMTRYLLRKFALLLGFAVLGTGANAGNIRGNWDPVFSLNYPNVGFSGEVVFFVPDACLSGALVSPGLIQNNGSAACSPTAGGIALLSATVTLYDTDSTNATPDGTPLNTLSFPTSPNPILDVAIAVSSPGVGMVIGLDTDFFGPVPSGISGSLVPSPLYLQLSSGFGDFAPAGAYLVGQSCSDSVCFPSFDPALQSVAGNVTYTPEPGTIALLLGGLGATFLARRRKIAA